MSISAISSTDPAYQAVGSANASTCQQDLQNLGKALQGGDLAGAQQSFAQLLQDRQSAGQSGSTAQAQGHHHHHHHGKAAASSQNGSTQTASTAQDSTAATSTQTAQTLLSIPASGILPADASTSAAASFFL